MEPHYFAGVTGAHKTLSVGVMSRSAIEANHAGAMQAGASGLKLEGNPVHEGIAEALGGIERSGAALFAVNQVLVDGELVAWTAGHPLSALEDGLEVVRKAFGFRIEVPVDLVVARMAPPLDRDLYQADKGIKNTEAAVRDGGVIVLEAGCEHGVGIDHFVGLLRAASTHARALEVIAERGYRLGDHKAVRLRALTDGRGVRVGLVAPGVDPSLESVLGMRVFADRNAAATWAAGLLPRQGARGLLVDDAGNKTLEVA
jgi:nickel-dependent lactate racemase